MEQMESSLYLLVMTSLLRFGLPSLGAVFLLCKFSSTKLDLIFFSCFISCYVCRKFASFFFFIVMNVMYDRCSEKRVSAVAVSIDGLYVCFADKFGVVWVVDLPGVDGNEAPLNKKAVPLLAHYCSIITSLVNNWLALFSVQSNL